MIPFLSHTSKSLLSAFFSCSSAVSCSVNYPFDRTPKNSEYVILFYFHPLPLQISSLLFCLSFFLFQSSSHNSLSPIQCVFPVSLLHLLMLPSRSSCLYLCLTQYFPFPVQFPVPLYSHNVPSSIRFFPPLTRAFLSFFVSIYFSFIVCLIPV